jgi:hypothetical protein
VKKRLSRRLTRFAGDGCLKIEMSNDSAGCAPLGQTRSAARVFSLVPAPEDGRAAIISTLIETANLNDVAGVLSSSRSREAFENGHRRRIDPSTFRASGYTHPKAVRASAQARKQTHAEVGNHGGVSSPLGAELMNVGPDFQAFVTRSTHLPSLPERGSWLVLFGFLRARFHGAVPLVVRMRILPGGDRLRLRG